jgi:hypothetical protein
MLPPSNLDAAEALHLAIDSFRLGMDAQGSNALLRFIDLLGILLQANPSVLGPAESMLLNTLLAAQARGDHLYIADLLQYELPGTDLGKALGLI